MASQLFGANQQTLADQRGAMTPQRSRENGDPAIGTGGMQSGPSLWRDLEDRSRARSMVRGQRDCSDHAQS